MNRILTSTILMLLSGTLAFAQVRDSVSIAVFGGSLSVLRESQAAKKIWKERLKASITDYGVGGAGFSSLQGHSMQQQVDEASAEHDIYVLWASTNDFNRSRECGVWSDYTVRDNYDTTRLATQCGGINYCIKTILEKNPRARIVFFTSLRFFSKPSGSDPFSEAANDTGLTFTDYVKAQKECCEYYGIPVLDQFNIQGINKFNYQQYYRKDQLHMNEDGYRFIGVQQTAFLAQFL